jgi:hypothetical protein
VKWLGDLLPFRVVSFRNDLSNHENIGIFSRGGKNTGMENRLGIVSHVILSIAKDLCNPCRRQDRKDSWLRSDDN